MPYKDAKLGPSIHVTATAYAKLRALSDRSGRPMCELASMALVLLDSVSKHLRMLGGHHDEERKG
jgi:DNA-binding transcriptional ArsR family regulator